MPWARLRWMDSRISFMIRTTSGASPAGGTLWLMADKSMLLVLETGRLTLRRIGPDDDAFIVGLLNEPSFLLHIGDKGVRTCDDARGYIAGERAGYERFGFGVWLVGREDGREALGICRLL